MSNLHGDITFQVFFFFFCSYILPEFFPKHECYNQYQKVFFFFFYKQAVFSIDSTWFHTDPVRNTDSALIWRRFWKSTSSYSYRWPNTRLPITLATALFILTKGSKGQPVCQGKDSDRMIYWILWFKTLYRKFLWNGSANLVCYCGAFRPMVWKLLSHLTSFLFLI